MPLAPIPFEALAQIAMAVPNSPTLESAVDLLVTQLSQLFDTEVTLFERRDRQWVAIAGIDRPFEEDHWRAALATALEGTPAVFLADRARDLQATALSLTGPGGPPLVLVVDGDWAADHSTLKVFGLLVSMGLDALRHRDERRAAGRRVLAAYAMARRLSRVHSVEHVSQLVVDQIAALLDADRVSLALYNPSQQALSIVATHGYPLSEVRDVAIPSGAWVTGHVYAHGRPIFVSDVRLFPAIRRDRYRTHAFAVVPLIAGSETVGVLSVTETRHGGRFSHEDEMLLRGISTVAALAIVAAQSLTEAATLAHAATTDSVTNLLNRPYLDNRLREEVARSKREGTPLAVLIGDIDDFKRINDAYGHQVGDQVLRIVGGVIRSAVRVFDVCARYGGDEFAVLMPNCDRPSAIACAERIRARIAESTGGNGAAALPAVTMSLGAAVIEDAESAAELMARADQCLYQAKADGKNLVRADVRTRGRLNDSAVPTQSMPVPVRQAPSPYVLVADADDARAALCAGIGRQFGLRVTVSRSSPHAISMIGQSGPPAVLIVDLSLPPAGGFAVIDALRDEGQTEIIAWSASREISEYATGRAWPNARVLSGSAPASTIRAALGKLLHPLTDGSASQPSAAPTPEQPDKIMKTLAEKAQQLCHTAGVAVCLKAPGDTGFRTFLNWTSDESLPHLPYAVPRAVDRVIATGRPIPDIGGRSSFDDHPHDTPGDFTRGLAAAPILFAGEVAGAICIFDVKPVALDDRTMAALAALGRNVFADPQEAAAETEAPPFRDRAADRRLNAEARSAPRPPQIDWPPAILERTGGEFAVARELARARREGRQLGVVLFDVGTPAAGDAPAGGMPEEHLAAVSDTLLRAIRQSDLPIRWNVSELLVVLPGLAGDQARSVAERVRAALQAGAGHRLRVSGGVAELENDERFADVVQRAREKVALAVGRGHNRVL